ncbi:MAG: translocation/assembly module TamB domain-containing protein [Fidelibacterota bacterium]|nr:MAG: translocation/assembly module TamB domain-containing protein [Candidatus Neomarinimicrobiota bacterium]
MKRWRKVIRSLRKVLILVLVAAFTVVVFFPGLFTKYLQSYANRKYLNPSGLRVSYNGFVGDLFGSFQFQDITVTARDGSFTLRAEDARMNIDFFRFLRRDLFFEEVSVARLRLDLQSMDSSDTMDGLETDRLPWVSIQNFNVKDATITQGDTDFWFQISGNLDMTETTTLKKARLNLAHPQLPDTLYLAAEHFAFNGRRIAIESGNLSYQGNRVALDGGVQVIPRVDLDLYVKSDQFLRPASLPGWLDCQSVEGYLRGNLKSLECRFSLDLYSQNHPLDRAEMDFRVTDSGIHIDRSFFAKGSQHIEAHGEVDPSGSLALDASFSGTRLNDFLPGVPELMLDGTAGLKVNWHGDDIDSLQLVLALDRLGYWDHVLRDVHGGVAMENRVWTITDTTNLQFAGSDIQLWGSVDAEREILDLEVYLQTDVLGNLLDSLGLVPIKGRANGQLWASDSWHDPSFTGAVMLNSTGYGEVEAGQAFIQFILDNAITRPRGRLYASTGDLNIMGMLAEGGEAEFIFKGDTVFASVLRIYQGLEKLDTRGYLTLSEPLRVVLDTVTAWRNTEVLAGGPVLARRVGEKIEISPVILSVAGGQIALTSSWTDPGNFAMQTSCENIKLERLFRFLGKPPRLLGVVAAAASLDMQGSHLALTGTAAVTDGELSQMPFTQLSSEFFLKDNRLVFKQLDWVHQDGKAEVTGELAYALDGSRFGSLGALDSLDLQGRLTDFQFHDLQPILPWKLETHGWTTGTFTARGQANHPVYSAALSIADPRFDRVAGELLTGRMQYERQRMQFSDLTLKTATGTYSGGGTLPADLSPTTGALDVISDAPVDLAFSGTTTQLDFLTPYFGDVDSLNGEYEIEIALSGTFEQLIRNGKLTARNGKVELFIMENPIVGVEGELVLMDNLLVIERLEGHTPYGSRRGKDNSRLTVSGTMDMTRFFKPVFDLQLSGEHVYFARPLGEIEAVGSPALAVTGRDTVYFQGDFVPDPDQAFLRMDFTGPESYALKKADEGTILIYDIHIPLYSGVTIENSDVNAEVEGEITLTKVGSEDFRFAGTIDVLSGSFVYNGYDFVFDEGTVTLEPSTLNPRFYIRATTQVDVLQSDVPTIREDEPVDVTLVLTGTLDDPQMSFESSALYSESDFLQLFALGQSLEEGVDIAVTGGLSLTNIVLRRIEEEARQFPGLDRFQIQTASPRTVLRDMEAVRIHIGKRLWSKVYMGLRADPTLSYTQAQIAFRINRNMSLVGSVDEKGLVQIKYRLKFRY